MKKLFVFAFALAVGLCQCKKKVETISSVPAGVHITLDVDGGEKVIVDPYYNPTYALVTFEQGDVIYVGNNGAYCGYLTYNGTSDRFEGTIEPTSTDNTDYLHFYFMGNKGPVGSAPSSVYIADQTDRYPVISYGRSTYLYSSGTSNYSARLYNYCAIMRFDVTGASTNDVVTITGMNNIVTVDFSKNNGTTTGNPYTYSMTESGDIRLHNEANDERWAILLPQADVLDATASAGGYTHSSVFTVPAVSANGYYNNPVSVAINSYTPGEFSVNSSGTKVILAPANLQYTKSTGIWSFMGRQWSMVETQGQNVGDNYANQDVVSLFGWGTSGYDHGAVAYQPYSASASTSTHQADYYAYGNHTYNLYDQTGQADWGYNAISNGGNRPGQWRTLTYEEWKYLINLRQGAAQKYGHGKVGNVNGIILLPDDWTVVPSGLTFTAGNSAWSNVYTSEQWSAMEANGAVFLPAALKRIRTTVGNVNNEGIYWSASRDDYNIDVAGSIRFVSGNIYPQSNSENNTRRDVGCSVRLVTDVAK